MFSLFKKKDIQGEILSDLNKAKKSIKVAVSWLTDPILIKALIESRKKGVEVNVLLSSHELNIIRFEHFKKLQDMGGTVNKWGNKESDQGQFMHYKFYIIDDKLAKSGSYNWSINAMSNAEALDEVPVGKKNQEFEELFKLSVDFFHEIENPEEKRAELEIIRKEKKQEILTPETLNAYRETQKIKREYEEKQKREREAVTREALRREQDLKAQLEKAKAERKRMEELETERKRKEQTAQYKPKESVKDTKLPPTSYGEK